MNFCGALLCVSAIQLMLSAFLLQQSASYAFPTRNANFLVNFASSAIVDSSRAELKNIILIKIITCGSCPHLLKNNNWVSVWFGRLNTNFGLWNGWICQTVTSFSWTEKPGTDLWPPWSVRGGGGAGAGGRAEYPDVLLLRNIGTDRKEVRHLWRRLFVRTF